MNQPPLESPSTSTAPAGAHESRSASDEFSLAAGRLMVRFCRLGDRWRHALSVIDGAHAHKDGQNHDHALAPGLRVDPAPWVESVEGLPDETWPASPPWQEIERELRGTSGQVLLLVGKAGKSHWSLAVSADQAREALRFEIACRVREAPQWLGSMYSASAAGSRLEPGTDRTFCCVSCSPASGDGQRPRLMLRAHLPGQGEPNGPRLKQFGWRPTASMANQFPATVVWSYQWQLIDATSPLVRETAEREDCPNSAGSRP